MGSAKIVLVDDDHQSADLLKMVLELQPDGFEVLVAYSGADVLIMASAVNPEVGILDLEMPGMDGEETAHKLRRICASKPIRLFALSGNVVRLGKMRQGEPFDQLLSKPVDLATLLRLIRN